MKGEVVDFSARIASIRCDAPFATALRSAGLADLGAISSRALGTAITDHRSSWVRLVEISGNNYYVKTYDYSTIADSLRGAFRTTVFARSRATREARALGWLRRHGFAAPRPRAVGSMRRFGVLRRAVLVTERFGGVALDRLLARPEGPDSGEVLAAVECFVERLHRAGFRDRNLDARNLIVDVDAPGGPVVAKIDSPRFRLVRPGRTDDALARADRERLAASLAELGVLARP